MYIPTYEDMLAAHMRIAPHILRTPVRTSGYLNELTGARLVFKCENFQGLDTLKVRGATNGVFGLDERLLNFYIIRLAGRTGPRLPQEPKPC